MRAGRPSRLPRPFRRLFPKAGKSWLELVPANHAGIRELYALLDEGILEAWMSDDDHSAITLAETGQRLDFYSASNSARLTQTPRGGRGRRARGLQVCRRPRFPVPPKFFLASVAPVHQPVSPALPQQAGHEAPSSPLYPERDALAVGGRG